MLYVIGIGTNLGNRIKNLNIAIAYLYSLFDVKKLSRIYRSSALLSADCPLEWNLDFLNMAALIDYTGFTHVFFEKLQDIETAMGKKKESKYAPRVIDLDILIADSGYVYNKKNLQIPHKELLNRDFALAPAQEVAPDFFYPLTNKKLSVLYKEYIKAGKPCFIKECFECNGKNHIK